MLARIRAALGRGPGSGRFGGVTLLELLVAVTLLGIVFTIGAVYLTPMEAPLRTAASLVESALRQTRARAIATTTMHRIRPQGDDRLLVERATSCSAPESEWVPVPELAVQLPSQVWIEETVWSVCFSTRGIADGNVRLTLHHPQFGSRQIEVLKGGVMR
jgi:prepilin-type N-terminal cleavage/methylation domain-containing protein